jgi:hypothetical protein
MKSEQWKSYRTRFLVKAKQLSSSLSFVDHLGRQHCGRKGDYLVESSDGVLSIAPRRIFEDIYVPMVHNLSNSMSTADHPALDENVDAEIAEKRFIEKRFGERKIGEKTIDELHFNEKLNRQLDRRPVEPLHIERVKLRPVDSPSAAAIAPRADAARVRRKLPQPCRDRRSSASHASLM